MSEEKTGIHEALAEFQKQVPDIDQTSTGKVSGVTKTGKPYSYEFKYASLPHIRRVVRPVMAELGLYDNAYVSEVDDKLRLQVVIHHPESKETIKSEINIVKGKPQDVGGQITFYTRYFLAAMLGISGDEDVDIQPPTEKPPALPNTKSVLTDIGFCRDRDALIRIWNNLPQAVQNSREVYEAFAKKGAEFKDDTE